LDIRQKHADLLYLGTRLRKSLWKTKPDGEEAPLLSELFSREQMKQHGKTLAASHTVARGHAPDQLLARLADNEKILNETCDLLTTATKANRRIAPAGEWRSTIFI
jgi:cyclic beta-1,2-glucan synthetase